MKQNKNQFYVAYYGKLLVAQTVAPIDAKISDVIEKMEKYICFSSLKDQGYSESNIKKLIRMSEIKTYPIGNE